MVVHMDTTRRPHTGRKRNDAAREAILDAAMRLLARPGGEPVTVDLLAKEAGVGKQTIYRWWDSKGEVLLDALNRNARMELPSPDTGTLEGDLLGLLGATFRAAGESATAGMLRTLAAEAPANPHIAELLQRYTASRRAVLRGLLERGLARGELAPDTDLDLIVDQIYGLLWYRLLLRHRPLTQDTAERLTRMVLAGNRL
jgi:AcrR family transcriptional regulator